MSLNSLTGPQSAFIFTPTLSCLNHVLLTIIKRILGQETPRLRFNIENAVSFTEV